MKNMIPIACLFILGLTLISYKKPQLRDRHPLLPRVRQLATVPSQKISQPPHQVLPKVAVFTRQPPSSPQTNTQNSPALPIKKTAMAMALPPAALQPPVENKTKVEASSLQVPTQKDIELLRAVSERSRQQGSKVAYIGELPSLYAFEPRFFSQQANDVGDSSWQIQGVNDSSSGFFVQREPYPLPKGGLSDYSLLSKVIIRAASDGAILINIAAPGLDRSRLTAAINYAHTRGVPVIAISP